MSTCPSKRFFLPIKERLDPSDWRVVGELVFAMVAVKRFLTLASESLMNADEGVIELKEAAIGSFALELALLKEGLVQSFTDSAGQRCAIAANADR